MSHYGQEQTFLGQASCPLYPRKQTLISTVVMSALCQKRTRASPPKPHPVQRRFRRHDICVRLGRLLANAKEESMPVVDPRIAGKPVPRVSKETMERECVAREKRAKALDVAFLDQRIPRYEREIINMVGMGVTENAALKPNVKG